MLPCVFISGDDHEYGNKSQNQPHPYFSRLILAYNLHFTVPQIILLWRLPGENLSLESV